jgi:hypothetical protein
MLEGGAVREVLVSRHGEQWGLAIRSRREARRTWASLTAVGRFADGIGLRGFSVER